ncbi:gamma carbonic anhydrase family protein [uncultured Desulfobacter sp.]|uniref:gamma carbonic anhydrase family protein n=1 Tax=uncultured Desulfobacter sp. TaxID=240139 RepID=UPI0037497D26
MMTLYAFKNIRPEIHDSVFVAPTAQIMGDVHIAKDASVWFQTVIRGDTATISIGERTNIQDLSMCHADEGVPLTVGNSVTVGHQCCLHGCTIEDDCLIGMGATVMNHAVIGKGSVVAAGAVVLEKTIVPPYSLVVGSPGKVKKTYENKEEITQVLKVSSDLYAKKAKIFADKNTFYEIK